MICPSSEFGKGSDDMAHSWMTCNAGGLDSNTFHARTTLQQAEEAMRSQPMLRVSRSCLVNINHVCAVNRTLRGDFVLVLRGGTQVSSSQGYRDKARAYLETMTLGRT
jgi:DNA-binding LytR/AlgR family response regulator